MRTPMLVTEAQRALALELFARVNSDPALAAAEQRVVDAALGWAVDHAHTRAARERHLREALDAYRALLLDRG